MNIDYELYKVFYYVGTHLSFSKAAKDLFISQSAVSQSIKQLEEKLGTTLFFRNTKNVQLSAEGKILFAHIQSAFSEIQSGELALNKIKNLKQGQITIGASDTICKYHLLPYIQLFHQRYPEIKLNIINRPSPAVSELLKNHQVDLGIINIPPAFEPDELNVTEFKYIQDVFICGAQHKALAESEVSLKTLARHPFLALEKNSTTRLFLDALFRKNNLEIKPEIEINSIDLLIELTKIGLGISFVMFESVRQQVANNEIHIIPTIKKIPKRKIGILTHKDKPASNATRRFIETLLK